MHIGELDYNNEDIVKIMRDHLLIDLISNREKNKKRLKEKMSGLNLDPYTSFPTIALLEPAVSAADEHKKRKYAEELRDFLEHKMTDDIVVFMHDDSHICLLFSWVSRSLIEKIQQSISVHLTFQANIGVGIPCSQLSDIHHSYQQAELSLQHKFYKGKGQIIYYREVSKYHSLGDYPFVKERELFHSLKSAEDSHEIGRGVDAFYEFILHKGPVEIKEVYEMTIRLLIGLEKKVFTELGKENAYKKYEIMSIVNMETLQEIQDYLKKYLAELWEALSLKSKVTHRSIIEKTLQYMEQECQNASLNNVSQKVYMTPTYLSLLFKMNTGKTFIEQLTDIRIDKAKHLLKNSLLKNYEVAEKVGYHDSRYFSQIFKKKVGLSPSVYRESLGK